MIILYKILKYIILLVILIIIFPYLICPFYEYPEIRPFYGNKFYNPYENIDSTKWMKANFHAHSRQWTGITAGSSNRENDVADKYREINYDIIGISDYQSINTFLANDPAYVPVYEHGYGALKSHQLVIGAKDVSWLDFLLLQSYHNSQEIIVHLRKNNEVISINHPKLRDAFTPQSLKYLGGYDLLEITSHSYFNAADLWDTVLSSGNPVFALGSDDNHDISDPEDFGYVYTMVNSPQVNQNDIMNALRSGTAFAVELEPQKDSSPKKKVEQSGAVPLILSCKINNDTMVMNFNKPFDTLKLIGQNGVIQAREVNKNNCRYLLKDTDTYIRAEISHKNMINVFLNPVFRFNGVLDKRAPEIDFTKTWIFRGIYIIIISAVFFVFKRYKKKTKTRHSM